MSVLINRKVCDNASECSCISDCPTNAFYFDEENNSVAVKQNLCVNCRECMIACPAGAVKVSRTDEEYQKIKKEYDEDIRTVEELFVDRYGAAIINEDYDLPVDDLDELINDSNKLLLIEFYNIDEADCLINSVPISEIIDSINTNDISYRKIDVSKKLDETHDISIYPTLLLLKDNEVIGKYEGSCKFAEKDKILNYFKSLEI